MRTQELVIKWHSVKDDGMPSKQSIINSKNRFWCIVKTLYMSDESEISKRTVRAFVKGGEFLGFSGSPLNFSYDGCFISRVTEWAEIPELL